MRRVLALTLLLIPNLVLASVFGVVKGVVHDPQHRPIAGAEVLLKSSTSDWRAEATTNDAGLFQIQTVPLGDYSVTVTAPGFVDNTITIRVVAGNA